MIICTSHWYTYWLSKHDSKSLTNNYSDCDIRNIRAGTGAIHFTLNQLVFSWIFLWAKQTSNPLSIRSDWKAIKQDCGTSKLLFSQVVRLFFMWSGFCNINFDFRLSSLKSYYFYQPLPAPPLCLYAFVSAIVTAKGIMFLGLTHHPSHSSKHDIPGAPWGNSKCSIGLKDELIQSWSS